MRYYNDGIKNASSSIMNSFNSQSYVWFYSYKYIAKIPKEEPVEEMTMEQVCKALGKKIKIIE